jgi:hypothetical protein
MGNPDVACVGLNMKSMGRNNKAKTAILVAAGNLVMVIPPQPSGPDGRTDSRMASATHKFAGG